MLPDADAVFANPDMPKLLLAYGEMPDTQKEKFESELTQEQKLALYMGARAQAAKSYPIGEDGFSAFYWCMSGHELPPYAWKRWLPSFVKTYYEKRGTMLMGFRGSTKSTFLFWWSLYVAGKNPVGSTMFVKINDASAKETAAIMARTIEESPRWKFMFPTVVPDSKRWNLDGYDLANTEVPYGKWTDTRTRDHLSEPSLLCAGVEAGIIIGKHPTNGAYFDDLHDKQNTRSAREMEAVKETFRDDIIPTWNRPNGHPPLGVACTPWAEDDVYSVMMKTGKFDLIKTPILEFCDDGNEEWDGKKCTLAWPEAYPMDKVNELLLDEEMGPTQFARMYLVDLTALKGTVLKHEYLHEYPRDRINPTWPRYIGVDFASTPDKLKAGKRDYLAIAEGVGVPGVGVVLIDGVREHWSTEEALQYLKQKTSITPELKVIGIEKYGKGEEFFNLCRASLGIKVIGCPVDGVSPKGKGERYAGRGGLEHWFYNSKAWIADVKTPFINHFIDEWIGWDGEKTRTGHDDCLDAVYWLLYVSQQHLAMPSEGEMIGKRERKPSPFNALGDRYAQKS